MGFADGYYYGQGRIICDTSTFSVGDTIRVRSMTDSSKVWNQQVATVGTALVFTVPCYDYYKICTVQTIGGVATEVGGVYKTVDYGQTLYIDNVLDLSTLQGIQGVLNAHNENQVLNIGDEVTIKINDGGTPIDWIMLIAGIDIDGSHSVTLSSKRAWKSTIGRASYPNPATYADSAIRTMTQSFYSTIDSNEQPFIKEVTKTTTNSNGGAISYSDKIWTMASTDLVNVYPLYTTQANRVKKEPTGLTQVSWWTSTGTKTTANNGWVNVDSNGNAGQYNCVYSATNYVVPCVVLQADS